MDEFTEVDSSGKKEKVKFTDANTVQDEFFERVEVLLKNDVFETECAYWQTSPKYRLGVFVGKLTPESKNWGVSYPVDQLEQHFFKPKYMAGGGCAERLKTLLKKYGITKVTRLAAGSWNLISIRTPKLAVTFIDSPFRVSTVEMERDALLNDVPKGSKEQTAAEAVNAWKKKRGF